MEFYKNRFLEHALTLNETVLDGPNDSLRAERDSETGLCHRYKESLDRHFLRIGFKVLFLEKDLSNDDALKIYGLYQ